ncbi:leucine-rich repeats and immunoglobulin-like domains protein 3 [Pollicipes pollicipes]|uniref:leucine-rich repeats and immunoglobulin-like domains protein 3 n=1 Tax=Pollicipes pollicipes TaxID=41117 RepID=UPI0018851DA6|nr:leucine-rich repeats and immunoglobulin-like domains protein 3 [Pollicipes pollicipes]
MHVLPSEHVFFIVRVQPADQGTYTCRASNDAGEIQANATLSVLEVPSFVRPMEHRQVVAGETAVLDCMASGSPAPRLTWTKDGAPLLATERHFYTAGQQLLIIVQTTPADAGSYECQLSNVLGEERGSATLTVLPGPSFGLDDDSTYAIIIIAVVSGVVVTSLVWVIIIYHARKRSLRQLRARAATAAFAAGADRQLSPPPPRAVAVYASGAAASLLERRASSVQLYTGDDGSEHSSGKDSGQGGHDEATLEAVVAVADSDDEGVGGNAAAGAAAARAYDVSGGAGAGGRPREPADCGTAPLVH